MTGLSDLNNEDKRIPTSVLKIACGNPSAELWSQCRICAGVSEGKGNKGAKRRKVSEWEAFMIWVRRYWREACEDSGIEYISNPTTFQAEDVAKDIAQKYERWAPKGIVAPVFLGLDELTGNEVLAVVKLLAGKISERSLRRICGRSGVPTFTRKQKYSRHQILQILRAVNETRPIRVA